MSISARMKEIKSIARTVTLDCGLVLQGQPLAIEAVAELERVSGRLDEAEKLLKEFADYDTFDSPHLVALTALCRRAAVFMRSGGDLQEVEDLV